VFHPLTWSADPYCYLEDLFVTPAARGTGTARQLLEAVFAEARRLGADRTYCGCGVTGERDSVNWAIPAGLMVIAVAAEVADRSRHAVTCRIGGKSNPRVRS
jgi:GNAT superfamily N-acetyltransferase